MAKYEKGQSGNPAGRPKGTENKVTKESRQLFQAIMDGEVIHIEEALALLRENNAEKYLKALASLFPYFMPKKVEAEISVNESPKEPSWFGETADHHVMPDTSALLDE